MDSVTEAALRTRVSALVLEWRQQQGEEFSGQRLEDFAAMIVASNVILDESRIALRRWVDAGRHAGMSWADIGALTGTTRQAAQQRFGGAPDTEGLETSKRAVIVRQGVTAFNELAILAEEGNAGRELIATGLLTLTFRPSAARWEYKRAVALSPQAAQARLSRNDWVYVSSWFPFHYFKRRSSDLATHTRKRTLS